MPFATVPIMADRIRYVKWHPPGVVHSSDHLPFVQLVRFGPGGTVPFDTCTLNSVSLHCVQEWRDGVDGEVLEFLAKLAEREKGEPESRKYCLNFFLAYAFKGQKLICHLFLFHPKTKDKILKIAMVQFPLWRIEGKS